MHDRSRSSTGNGIPPHIKLFALTACGFAALVAVFAPDAPKADGSQQASAGANASSAPHETMTSQHRPRPGEHAAPNSTMTDERFFGRYDADPYVDDFGPPDQSGNTAARREFDVDLADLEQYRPDDPDSQLAGGAH